MAHHHHLHEHARRHHAANGPALDARQLGDLNIPGVEISGPSSDSGFDMDGHQPQVSIVYVTASATFSGPTGGFTTLSPSSQPSSTPNDPPSAASTTQSSSPPSSTSSVSSSVANTISSTSSHTTLSISTTSGSTLTSAVVTHATSVAEPSVSPVNNDKSGGLSGGAKAGIAIVVLLAVGAIAGVAYFLYRKKQREQDFGGHTKLDNEKTEAAYNASRRMPSMQSTAPHLSLRPTTAATTEHEKNAMPIQDPFGSPSAHESAWERRAANAPGATNPFGSQAETLEATTFAQRPIVPHTIPRKPASIHSTHSELETPATPTSIASASTGMVATASTAKATPSNVHRVQMDFKPSMDDELELTAGQLVRLLHEYDDGWALCIRMDRSQQGVAPRTCLSKVPLKPRPARPNPPANGSTDAKPSLPAVLATPSSPRSVASDVTMVPRPLTPTGAPKPANMSPFPATENVHGNQPRSGRTKSVKEGSSSAIAPVELADNRARSQSVVAGNKNAAVEAPAPLNISRPSTPTSATSATMPSRKPVPGPN